MANSASSDHIPSFYGGDGTLFDIPRWYLDSLTAQDHGSEASPFDLQTPPEALVVEPSAPPCLVMQYTPGVVNLSSTSSSSKEVAVESDQENNTESDDDQEQLNAKNSNPEKQCKRRFAFLTETEVDYLDDGYKWRKYGKKSLKNNPFPRNYYRCTSESCGVKKTTERTVQDQSILVTTYEGYHTHPCPITRSEMLLRRATNGGFSSSVSPPLYHQQPPEPTPFYNQNGSLNINLTNSNTTTSFPSSYSHYLQEGPYCPSPLPSSVHRDDGLLQDLIIPFQVRKEEP